MKFIPVAFLYFAAEALAGRIQYTTGYTTGGINGQGGTEKKAAGTIPDDKDALVIEKMGIWSNNEFVAKRNVPTQIITVSRVNKVLNKAQAIEAISQAQKIVSKNIK